MLVNRRRNNERDTPCSNYLTVIAFTKFAGLFVIISGNTNDRSMFSLRETAVHLF
jgi:hypothetical protein